MFMLLEIFPPFILSLYYCVYMCFLLFVFFKWYRRVVKAQICCMKNTPVLFFNNIRRTSSTRPFQICFSSRTYSYSFVCKSYFTSVLQLAPPLIFSHTICWIVNQNYILDFARNCVSCLSKWVIASWVTVCNICGVFIYFEVSIYSCERISCS